VLEDCTDEHNAKIIFFFICIQHLIYANVSMQNLLSCRPCSVLQANWGSRLSGIYSYLDLCAVRIHSKNTTTVHKDSTNIWCCLLLTDTAVQHAHMHSINGAALSCLTQQCDTLPCIRHTVLPWYVTYYTLLSSNASWSIRNKNALVRWRLSDLPQHLSRWCICSRLPTVGVHHIRNH